MVARDAARRTPRSVNRGAHSAMSLVSLLASTTLITLASSTPLTYAVSSQRAKIPVDHDHFLLILLLNRRDSELKPKLVDEAGGVYRTAPELAEALGGSLTRDKRIGSLSIVNSVDVLRQRVLLELARRKAMEDQRQISENRRILDSVGKRSQPPRLYGGRERRKTRLQYHLEGPEARAEEAPEQLDLVEQ